MKTQFYILLSLKTQRGFTIYGQYFVGNYRTAADELFRQLKGEEKIRESDILHIDLMETAGGVPKRVKSISCTLEELGVNCKLIARETFRLHSLEEVI